MIKSLRCKNMPYLDTQQPIPSSIIHQQLKRVNLHLAHLSVKCRARSRAGWPTTCTPTSCLYRVNFFHPYFCKYIPRHSRNFGTVVHVLFRFVKSVEIQDPRITVVLSWRIHGSSKHRPYGVSSLETNPAIFLFCPVIALDRQREHVAECPI